MKFLIINDDYDFSYLLKNKLNQYFKVIDVDISSHIPKALCLYDAYFLDVIVRDEHIFPFVRKIRNSNKDVPIIFITPHTTFCSECYKYNALYVIYKPEYQIYLTLVLNKLKRELNQINEVIEISYGNNHGKIKLSDIIYICKEGNYVIIYTINNHYKLYTSMKKFITKYNKLELFNCLFIHTNYGTLVNKNCIMNYSDIGILLSNNQILPVSRNYKNNIIKYINRNHSK